MKLKEGDPKIMCNPKCEFPWWEKSTFSIEEASIYFGIGSKKLRNYAKENIDAPYILQIGTHIRIKKNEFEKHLCNDLSTL